MFGEPLAPSGERHLVLPRKYIWIAQGRRPVMLSSIQSYSPAEALPFMAGHLESVMSKRKTLEPQQIADLLEHVYRGNMYARMHAKAPNISAEAEEARLRGESLKGFLEKWNPDEESRIRELAERKAGELHELLLGRHVAELKAGYREMVAAAKKQKPV